MQFAATFVEYLVTGTVAAIWIVPLVLWIFGVSWASGLAVLDPWKEAVVVFGLPVLYVLGMYVDALSSLVLKTLKRRIRGEKKGIGELYDHTVSVLARSPELAQEMRALTARDRIARGTSMNILASIPVICLTYDGPRRGSLVVATSLMAVVSLLLWWRFDNHTREFKESAVRTVPDRQDVAG